MPKETQLQEPTEAAKCAGVQEPILKRVPRRSVKEPLEKLMVPSRRLKIMGREGSKYSAEDRLGARYMWVLHK